MSDLRREVADLDTDKNVFPLKVSLDVPLMKEISGQIKCASQLMALNCDPSEYEIVVTLKGNKVRYWNIELSGKSDEPFLGSKSVFLQLDVRSKSVKETSSLRNLIHQGKAVLEGSKQLCYPVKAVFCEKMVVSVKVLGQHIVSSPITVSLDKNQPFECANDRFELFSNELNTQHAKQGCSTYYMKTISSFLFI